MSSNGDQAVAKLASSLQRGDRVRSAFRSILLGLAAFGLWIQPDRVAAQSEDAARIAAEAAPAGISERGAHNVATAA